MEIIRVVKRWRKRMGREEEEEEREKEKKGRKRRRYRRRRKREKEVMSLLHTEFAFGWKGKILSSRSRPFTKVKLN